jgi:hypothetical protein
MFFVTIKWALRSGHVNGLIPWFHPFIEKLQGTRNVIPHSILLVIIAPTPKIPHPYALLPYRAKTAPAAASANAGNPR